MAGVNGTYGIVKDHAFHVSAVAAADGSPFEVGAYKTLAVDIDGAPTSHTVLFKCTGANGVEKTLKGMKVSDWATGTSTSGTSETWQFDITGLKTVIMDISAMVPGAGSLTVKGTAVA